MNSMEKWRGPLVAGVIGAMIGFLIGFGNTYIDAWTTMFWAVIMIILSGAYALNHYGFFDSSKEKEDE